MCIPWIAVSNSGSMQRSMGLALVLAALLLPGAAAGSGGTQAVSNSGSMQRSMGPALVLATLLLPGAAAAGGGGVTESGFLQTPTYTLALVLLFFLVISIAFEKVSCRGLEPRRLSDCLHVLASCRRPLTTPATVSRAAAGLPCPGGVLHALQAQGPRSGHQGLGDGGEDMDGG